MAFVMKNTYPVYLKPSFSNGVKFIPIFIVLVVLNAFLLFENNLMGYMGFFVITAATISLLFLYRIKYREFYTLFFLVVLMMFFKITSQYATNNNADFGLRIRAKP